MMTPLRFALYLTYLFLGRSDPTTNLNSKYVRQQSGFYLANVGDNVTLQCFYEVEKVMFHWYKQTLGQKPRLMSTLYEAFKIANLFNEFNNSRFILNRGIGANHLTIADLRISDSATYYCVGCDVQDCEFGEGATVSLQDSSLNIQALVHQSAFDTVQPGGSVTLNCTVQNGICDGEHSVYWFKNSGESHPGLIHSHGGRNDQCENKPSTQTHTCVHNLPMKNLSLSHAEKYYCAVATCGHILFGNEKKLGVKHGDDSLALVYFLSGALTFTTILAVFLTYAAYTMNNGNSCQCTDCQATSSLPSTPNAEGYQDSDNIHYAALRKQKVNRSTTHRVNTQSECVYSAVRR